MALPHPRAFLLSVTTEYGTRRIQAMAGLDTPEGFWTPYDQWGSATGELTGFEVTAILDSDHERAWCFGYQYALTIVDLRRAETVVRVLRKVEKGMSKAQQQFGYPDTLHGYLLHVAYALGIKRFLVRSDDGQPFANGARYLTHNTPSIASWITRQEATYCPPATV
jgi:hypothetical protein